jgi:hypothetical protein
MQPVTLLAVFVMVVAIQALVWAPFISKNSDEIAGFPLEATLENFYNLGSVENAIAVEPKLDSKTLENSALIEEQSLNESQDVLVFEPILEKMDEKTDFTDGEFFLTTSKTTYKIGDVIQISGEIHQRPSNPYVILQVFDPDNFKIAEMELMMSSNNEFSTEITAEGSFWKQTGIYTIQAIYNFDDILGETYFVFDSTGKNTVYSD